MPREAGVITVRRAEPSDYEGICETFRDESAYSGTLQLPYPSAELWPHSEHQGRGVGSALIEALLEIADGWLNVFRLELTVFTDNERAIALYRKHGFEIEGTHKAYALRAGRYADVHAMARIRAKL